MKKHLTLIIACAFASPLIATGADSVITGSPQLQSQGTLSMDRLDTNRDNFVSRSEAQIGAGGTVLDFMTVDVDGDGRISGDELSAAQNNSGTDNPTITGALPAQQTRPRWTVQTGRRHHKPRR